VAIGRTDVPLAATGRSQAQELAERLEGMALRRIYASDLRRSRETAEPVAMSHGLSVEITADLRELDFGSWEGRRLADLWAESPAEASEWESDLRRVPATFGETFAELEARVNRFATRLPRCGDTLVVAHRGSLAVLYAQLSGISIATAWALQFELGGLSCLELS
jgi:broad specificity phosphatase PhoE